MKKSSKAYALLTILPAGLLLSGCTSDTAFSHPDDATTLAQGNSGTPPGGSDVPGGNVTPGPFNGSLPTPPPSTPKPDPTTVTNLCDPLTNGGTAGKNRGLKGKVYYSNGDGGSDRDALASYQPGVPGVSMLDSDLYLSAVNVPTRDFSLGFIPKGGSAPLKDKKGNDLIEYFGLDVAGKIAVPEAKAGNYQFALIADDGADINFGNDPEPALHLPNVGPNRIVCTQKTIALSTVGTKIRVRYFQGPRVRISLILLWRKVDPNAASPGLSDDYCGNGPKVFGDFELFDGEVQKPAYSDFIKRGWEVVPSDYYFLDNGENPCN